jgi:hypothetical protein
MRQALFSGVEETVDFAYQLQEPFRVLFYCGLCAQSNPSLSASRVAVRRGCMFGKSSFFAGISTIARIQVVRVCGHASKMRVGRKCLML